MPQANQADSAILFQPHQLTCGGDEGRHRPLVEFVDALEVPEMLTL